MILFREIEEADLPELAHWFSDIRKPYPIRHGVLPKIGIMAFDAEGPVACCYMKQDGSTVSRIEWISSNPKRANSYRAQAIDEMLKYVVDVLRRADPEIQIVEIYTQSDFIISACTKLNFSPVRNFTRLLYVYEDNSNNK